MHDEIKKDFDCTAFVSVSRNPDAKKLLKDIMYELHKGGQPGAIFDEIKHLIDLVRDFLRNKRYVRLPSRHACVLVFIIIFLTCGTCNSLYMPGHIFFLLAYVHMNT